MAVPHGVSEDIFKDKLNAIIYEIVKTGLLYLKINEIPCYFAWVGSLARYKASRM